MGLAGTGGSGVVTGTAMRPDNTGRDVGEVAAIAGTTVGAIAGSILSFGTAAAPLAAAAATIDAGVIAGRAYQDVQQNQQDANAAQRAQQQGLDAQMQARQSDKLKQAAIVQPGAHVDKGLQKPLNFKGPDKPVEQTPGAVTIDPALADTYTGDPNAPVVAPGMQGAAPAPPPGIDPELVGASDRRVKKSVQSGKKAAEDFLSYIRRRGAWPANVKDSKRG